MRFKATIHIFFLLLLLLANGCARNPWLEPVQEPLEKSIRANLLKRAKLSSSCTTSIDAETTISWQSTFKKGSLSGFLQIFGPSHTKIVAVNPLGQPIMALTTNGKSFQAINTLKREYSYGNLRSLSMRYNIPEQLLTGNWGNWLTGNIPTRDEDIVLIREDSSSRGIWLTTDVENGYAKAREHLLISTDSKHLLSRIISDQKDNITAEIEYGGWQEHGFCRQPTRLHITGISPGMEATIELQDILTENSFTEKDFSIQPPPGYVQHQFR